MVWVAAGVSGLFAVIHGIGVLAASSGPGAISFAFALWFIAPLIVLGATAFIARGMVVLGLITLLAVAIGIFDFVLLAQVPRDAQGGLVVLFGPVWEWPFVALALLVAVVSRVWSSRRSAYS